MTSQMVVNWMVFALDMRGSAARPPNPGAPFVEPARLDVVASINDPFLCVTQGA